MLSPCQALSQNYRGRDFFVGDVHGCFDRLAQALERVRFDPSQDRLISVGDLLDRGPYSEKAVEWLRQPFFYGVRGNHEDLYLRWRDAEEPARTAFATRHYGKNGGDWVRRIDEPTHEALASLIRLLPYILIVPVVNGRTIAVVHAELPDGSGWPALIRQPDDSDFLRGLLWGRLRLNEGRDGTRFSDKHLIGGLDAVVCGHAVVPEVQVLGNCVYMDTGGWTDQGVLSVLTADDILQRVEQAQASEHQGSLRAIPEAEDDVAPWPSSTPNEVSVET
jgi:serine/threonine protein phosphatase 1